MMSNSSTCSGSLQNMQCYRNRKKIALIITCIHPRIILPSLSYSIYYYHSKHHLQYNNQRGTSPSPPPHPTHTYLWLTDIKKRLFTFAKIILTTCPPIGWTLPTSSLEVHHTQPHYPNTENKSLRSHDVMLQQVLLILPNSTHFLQTPPTFSFLQWSLTYFPSALSGSQSS